MNNYQYKYNRFIEPLYGEKRNNTADNNLLEHNTLPHNYQVTERTDMTKYDVYSIDPDGCEDADDAFSIYEENDKLFLALHIADPTEYINIESSLWKDMEERIVTRYPSNKPPIHLMPHDIMSSSSLMVNEHGSIKKAVTIVTEIDFNTFLPINKIKILFTKIKIKKENTLTYQNASSLFYSINTIYIGLRISEALEEKRKNNTKAVKLNEVSNSHLVYNNNEPFLYKDSPTEKLIKKMIAEFAIFANSFVGEYLKINLEGVGLYRICPAREWLNTLYEGINGRELLNEIIVNGIKAEYISSVDSHDLIGAPEYIHFTSPIRRLTDCVCHYLLKYIHLKNSGKELSIPFSNIFLKKYSNDCSNISRTMKNIQYKDTKFRLIQAIDKLILSKNNVLINYYISSYTNSFLNIIIDNIDQHNVYLSYTLRTPKLKTPIVIKEVKSLIVTRVSCPGKFDEGSIPELDAIYV